MARRTLGRRLKDRSLLAQALACQARLRLGLALFPFRRVLRRVELVPVRPRTSDSVEVRRRVRAVERTSRFVPGARCLVQALAAKVLLARSGVPSKLRIGVAREADDLEAHAWLEARGRVVVGGRERAGFTPLSDASGEPE